MSRKEKLASEYAEANASNGFTKFVLLRGFLAGYAACEQDAKVMEEALKEFTKPCPLDTNPDMKLTDIVDLWVKTASHCREALANWKERGK